MKAAVLERRGAEGVSWRDFADPVPAPGESVLRVEHRNVTIFRNSANARSRRMNLDHVIARRFEPILQTYDWRDSALSALGLGIGDDPLDEDELS